MTNSFSSQRPSSLGAPAQQPRSYALVPSQARGPLTPVGWARDRQSRGAVSPLAASSAILPTHRPGNSSLVGVRGSRRWRRSRKSPHF
jgi:hypothetical protein